MGVNTSGLAPQWTAETRPRGRGPGGITKNERRFRKARDKELVPEAIEVLKEMLACSRDPEQPPAVRQRARLDFIKCCGLIPKHRPAEEVEALAAKLLDGMIAEAERRALAGNSSPVAGEGGPPGLPPAADQEPR